MIAPVMIPLMIVGGFDGVEPQMTFKVCDRHGRAVGVREAARLTNMSPAHVFYILHGQRKSARFERKMRELGLTFEPATLRAALKRQGKGGK